MSNNQLRTTVSALLEVKEIVSTIRSCGSNERVSNSIFRSIENCVTKLSKEDHLKILVVSESEELLVEQLKGLSKETLVLSNSIFDANAARKSFDRLKTPDESNEEEYEEYGEASDEADNLEDEYSELATLLRDKSDELIDDLDSKLSELQ